MQTTRLAIILGLVIMALSSCAHRGNNPQSSAEQGLIPEPASRISSVDETEELASDWPMGARVAAREMLVKYGQPQEETPSTLVWNENVAPFKRIIVHREEAPHLFPIQHNDALEHIISYRVNPDRANALTKFEGSLSFNRTLGELSVRGHNEKSNVLALNLAHEVNSGRRHWENARSAFAKQSMDVLNGFRTAKAEDILFKSQDETADVDRSSKFLRIQAQEAPPEARPLSREGVLRQAQQEEIAE